MLPEPLQISLYASLLTVHLPSPFPSSPSPPCLPRQHLPPQLGRMLGVNGDKCSPVSCSVPPAKDSTSSSQKLEFVRDMSSLDQFSTN